MAATFSGAEARLLRLDPRTFETSGLQTIPLLQRPKGSGAGWLLTSTDLPHMVGVVRLLPSRRLRWDLVLIDLAKDLAYSAATKTYVANILGPTQTVRFFDRSLRAKGSLRLLRQPWDMKLAADGKALVVLLDDGTLRRYEVPTGRLLARSKRAYSSSEILAVR